MAADPTQDNLDSRDAAFKRWASRHREPTLDCPPDFAADRAELSLLTSCIKGLETNHGDDVLEYPRYFREFTLWRLFPFNALSDDLILEIFRQGTFGNILNKRDASTMPILYSSVCKRWRNLALDASWLWTSLCFHDTPPYALTRHFLERSKSAPLTINIDISNKWFDWEDDNYWPRTSALTERLALLRPHIHRWGTFYCRTDNWEPIHGVLSTLQGATAPILKRLELRKNFDDLPLESSLMLDSIAPLEGGSPALQELVLHAVSLDWPNLTFRNLSVLELRRLSPYAIPTAEEFWTMLHNSPSLRKLVLIGSGPQFDRTAVNQFPRIELLCLEELAFQGSFEVPYTIDYMAFVTSMFIHGPRFHSLTLGRFAEGEDLLRALPILRSFSQVKWLLLSIIDFTLETASQWLLAMTDVCHLACEGRTTERIIMEALANPSQPKGGLCPSLTTLAPYDPGLETLSAVLRARIALECPIQSLFFDLNRVDDAVQFTPLRDIVNFTFDGHLSDSEEEWVGPDPSECEGSSMEED